MKEIKDLISKNEALAKEAGNTLTACDLAAMYMESRANDKAAVDTIIDAYKAGYIKGRKHQMKAAKKVA